MLRFQNNDGKKYWGTYQCYITNPAGMTSENDAQSIVLNFVGKISEITDFLSILQTIAEV